MSLSDKIDFFPIDHITYQKLFPNFLKLFHPTLDGMQTNIYPCVEEILNKIAKQFNVTYAGLMGMIQGFQIYLA